ncbi:hypothetical protein GCM10008941_28550 [Rhizomicrobium palustre]
MDITDTVCVRSAWFQDKPKFLKISARLFKVADGDWHVVHAFYSWSRLSMSKVCKYDSPKPCGEDNQARRKPMRYGTKGQNGSAH